MRSRSATVSSTPARSALFTTKMSAISMRPALFACTVSPHPGFTTTTVVSASPAISTSTCPTPTVSITTHCIPAASRTRAASGTATERPPRWPRVAMDRMKTSSSSACSSIRTRSPKIAPPVNGDDGSIASTPTLEADARISRTSAEVSVDFPAPGAPVIPMVVAAPAIAWVTSLTARASFPPRSTFERRRANADRSPDRAAAKSAAASASAGVVMTTR